MESLIWIALLVAGLFGMCVGNAIGNQYSRPVLVRAQRAEAALAALHRDVAAWEQAPEPVPVGAAQPPIVVNLHMQAPAPTPPALRVVDAVEWAPDPAVPPIDLDAVCAVAELPRAAS